MREREKLRAERKARELAEEHWEWVERWLHMVYADAFVHGYGHGVEDAYQSPEIPPKIARYKMEKTGEW